MPRLKERLRELYAQEENQKRLAAYDKATSEPDQLAAELTRVYPVVAARLAELATRLEANERTIEHINVRGLPAGSERLLTAEMVARGLTGFVVKGTDIPRITKSLRLPALRFDMHAPYEWPRS